jgi:hypothetical protein
MASELTLSEMLCITAELTGTQLSPAAAKVMALDLARYPEKQLFGALESCRRELKGRLTIAEIINRLDDGRPTADAAWAIMAQGQDEAVTIVINNEMAQAMQYARHLVQDDRVAARMAFKDSYQKIVAEARNSALAPSWFPSLGHDPSLRAEALQRALDQGILTAEQVSPIMPNMKPSLIHEKIRAIIGPMTEGKT